MEQIFKVPVGRFSRVVEVLEKLDLPKIVSEKIGLNWRTPELKIVHREAQADWEGLDTVYVDFNRGIWVVSGVLHELVHLILRQNDWTEDPVINGFIREHRQLRDQGRGEGYLVEQMIAYLLQRDIQKEVGASDKNYKELLKGWDESHFSEILEKEYQSEFLNRLGRDMISKWKRKKMENVIDWIRSFILRFE